MPNNEAYPIGRIGLRIRSDFDINESYDELDVVYSGGNSYIAKCASEGDAISDTDHWQLLAQGYDNSQSTLLTLNSGISPSPTLCNGPLRFRKIYARFYH